jgi:DNA-directed RNA polymerase specialized sigma24 family protein
VDHPASPLDDALALLGTLTPLQQARVLGALLDRNNHKQLSALRVQAVYDATRAPGATYATVAQQLGVSTAAVNKAVTQHRKALPSAMDTSGPVFQPGQPQPAAGDEGRS